MVAFKHKGDSRESVFLGKFKKNGKDVNVVSLMFPKSRAKLGFSRASDQQLQGKKGYEVLGSKGDASMVILFKNPSPRAKSRLSVSIPIPSWLSSKDQRTIARKVKGAVAYTTKGGRTHAI